MGPTEDLILIVGSNPLPNYLAARQLKPSRLHLVYTPETEPVRQRLAECLPSLPRPEIEIVDNPHYQIADATNVRDIRAVVDHLPRKAALHYTGGTKTMSTHLHSGWLRKGGSDEQASYLDDRRGELRFDNGIDQPITVDLSVDVILQLHGLKASLCSDVSGQPTSADALRVAQSVIAAPDRAAALYQRLTESDQKIKPAAFKAAPLSPAEYALGGLPDPLPGSDWPNKRVERWIDFLRGGWLEQWMKSLTEAAGVNLSSIHTSVKARGNGRDFEADIVLVRGHRLYVVSCTTEARNHHLCKAKLFEVALRARQLGGDLTRFAFVCLLDRNREGQAWAEVLQDQARLAWDASNHPCVFGLGHARTWLGGDVSALRDWLNS